MAQTLADFFVRSVAPFYGLFSSYVYTKYGIFGGGNHGPTFVGDWAIQLYYYFTGLYSDLIGGSWNKVFVPYSLIAQSPTKVGPRISATEDPIFCIDI